ncbi:basic proline-rich protein-like isoform X2 [Grus americana]|uniref:basic proline-rich protein-like isoform X2 n=1 Tax=Grus americana TaxID=9117 RepID=UPI0024078CB3|nr:basic proline-rich protein-like isoform X2 [Grus americana]
MQRGAAAAFMRLCPAAPRPGGRHSPCNAPQPGRRGQGRACRRRRGQGQRPAPAAAPPPPPVVPLPPFPWSPSPAPSSAAIPPPSGTHSSAGPAGTELSGDVSGVSARTFPAPPAVRLSVFGAGSGGGRRGEVISKFIMVLSGQGTLSISISENTSQKILRRLSTTFLLGPLPLLGTAEEHLCLPK